MKTDKIYSVTFKNGKSAAVMASNALDAIDKAKVMMAMFDSASHPNPWDYPKPVNWPVDCACPIKKAA